VKYKCCVCLIISGLFVYVTKLDESHQADYKILSRLKILTLSMDDNFTIVEISVEIEKYVQRGNIITDPKNIFCAMCKAMDDNKSAVTVDSAVRTLDKAPGW